MKTTIIITALLAVSLSGCAPISDAGRARLSAHFGNSLYNMSQGYQRHQYHRPVTCMPLSSNIGGPVFSTTCY